MNIIFLSSEFPPGPGGIGAHAHNLTLQLVAMGHQVTVYTAARAAYPANDFDLSQAAQVNRYPSGANPLKRLNHLLRFLKTHNNGVDWVILSGLANISLYNLIRTFVRSRVLCVVHGHEIMMAKGVSGFLVRTALMRVEKVVAVSGFSKRLLEQNGISRPVMIIPNGVNISNQIPDKHHDKNKLTLITIGSVTKRKGQQNVVAALPELVKRFVNVEYHIVGIPREQNEVKMLAERLGVEKQIVFHGAVTDEEKNRLLKQANVFMMLSENLPDGDVEGFGIAVLEANGVGLPALGSRGTGVEQAIDDGVSGYVIDAKDPIEICMHMEFILKNYDTLSKQAYAWAQKHDWSIIGKQYMAELDGN